MILAFDLEEELDQEVERQGGEAVESNRDAGGPQRSSRGSRGG